METRLIPIDVMNVYGGRDYNLFFFNVSVLAHGQNSRGYCPLIAFHPTLTSLQGYRFGLELSSFRMPGLVALSSADVRYIVY